MNNDQLESHKENSQNYNLDNSQSDFVDMNYELEYKRLSYNNSLQNKDFSHAPIYWKSTSERVARLLVIFSQLATILMAYFFGKYFVTEVVQKVTNQNPFLAFHLTIEGGVTLFIVLLTSIFSIFLIIPMIYSKKSGIVHGWALCNLILAIIYFIFIELFLNLVLTISSLVDIFTDSTYRNYAIYFILGALVITVIWIIGASILLVKSDDVRRRLHVE